MATLDNGLKFLENFDNWATADAPGKWTNEGSTTAGFTTGTVASGDKLRLNFTDLGSGAATFSAQIELEATP